MVEYIKESGTRPVELALENIGDINIGLTKEQIKKRQELFTYYQRLYNESKNPAIYWTYLYPLILDSVKVSTLKINQHNYVIDYDIKVGMAIDALSKRYITNPDYHFGSLSTLAYFAVLGVNRKPDIIYSDMSSSYEELVEEKLMREEHIIDDSYTPDLLNYENVDDLY